MHATKIILANQDEQRKLYGRFTEVSDGAKSCVDDEADRVSSEETGDYHTCRQSDSTFDS
jgi:hypothetical protein